jgi:hypothetical protein
MSHVAQTQLWKEACNFFSKNNMEYLELKYLSDGKAKLEIHEVGTIPI